MDPFNPETWHHQWQVFVTAPYIFLPLLVVIAIAAWWLRGRIDAGVLAAREERLTLATEREKDVREKMEALKQEFPALKASFATGAPEQIEQAAKTLKKVEARLAELSTANNELSEAITGTGAEAHIRLAPITIKARGN